MQVIVFLIGRVGQAMGVILIGAHTEERPNTIVGLVFNHIGIGQCQNAVF
ncbi:hypothetical protein GCM10007932_47300 [Vibrio penaeicida]|uniref:Uncharacterized protein n=1 Tax=Vibrio penaeicida TaxID=104609 RepID=A0AAV5NYJ2_9VIBR|nr:hypothetical protein GCM10007932_47300 [Vibrio penaeicida]